MKKNINPLRKALEIVLVPIGVYLLFALFSAIIQWSYGKNNKPQESVNDKEELSEMRVYHSHKGLVEVENGLLIIKR